MVVRLSVTAVRNKVAPYEDNEYFSALLKEE
jgi:hypothetical protein